MLHPSNPVPPVLHPGDKPQPLPQPQYMASSQPREYDNPLVPMKLTYLGGGKFKKFPNLARSSYILGRRQILEIYESSQIILYA